ASGLANYTVEVDWAGAIGNNPGYSDAGITLNGWCSNGANTLHLSIYENDTEGGGYRYLPVAAGRPISVRLAYAPDSGVIRVWGTNTTVKTTVSLLGHTPGLTWTNADYEFTSGGGTNPAPIPSFTKIAFADLTIDGAPAASILSPTAF